jgi:sugar phosphate isomerase/epimerase
MIARRSFLFGIPALARAAGKIHAGSQTNAWPIDPKNFKSLLDVLAALKGMGFEGYETGFRNLQAHFAQPREARARLDDSGLRFFGIHVFLLSYDPQTSIAPWELLQTVADGGAALGAERLIVSGGSTPDPAALSRKAKALDRIGKYCREKGLKFGYHNHDAEFRENGMQIEGLLHQTNPELVHLIFDAGHALEGGAKVSGFFSKYSGRIDGIHLRDARQHKEVPLGQGDYDWRPLAAAAQSADWDGWVLSEEERLSGEKPGEAAIRPAREAIQRLFGV